MINVQILSRYSYLTNWIVFTQNQFLSKSVPFCVEKVSCSCSTHHLHQNSPERRKTSGINMYCGGIELMELLFTLNQLTLI